MTKKSKWQQYKDKLGDTRPWDFLNPNTEYASEDEASRRYDICESCSELIDLTKQCKQCGCIMPLKTRLQNATCPLQKW